MAKKKQTPPKPVGGDAQNEQVQDQQPRPEDNASDDTLKVQAQEQQLPSDDNVSNVTPGEHSQEQNPPLESDDVTDDTENLQEAVTFVEYKGRKYGLNNRAPQKLKIDGQLFTHDELLNDEDTFISLIIGGSAFVKQI